MKIPFLASILFAAAMVSSIAQPANPTSTNAITAQWEQDHPNGGCYLAIFNGSDSYTASESNSDISGNEVYIETNDFHSAFVSNSPTSGSYSYLYFGVNNISDGTQSGDSNTEAFVWPLEANPGDRAVTNVWSLFEWDTSSDYAYGSMSTNTSGTRETSFWGCIFGAEQPVVWQNDDENFSTNYGDPWGTLTWEEKRNYTSDERLRTGGKAVPGRYNLFQLQVTAKKWAISLDPETGDWNDDPSYWASTAVPPGQIQVMTGQQVGSDGNLYVALPDGADLDVMPDVASKNYTASVTPQKYRMQIFANGYLLADDKVNLAARFCVGQYINFDQQFLPSLPSGTQTNHIQWAFDGSFVNDFVFDPLNDDDSGYYTNNPSRLTTENASAWWVSGGFSPPATYKATLDERLTFPNGQYLDMTANGQFTMFRPKISNFQITLTNFFAALVPSNSPNMLSLGNDKGGFMNYNLDVYTIAPFSGYVNVVQLANASCANSNSSQTTDGQFWLDNGYFYPNCNKPVNPPSIPYGYVELIDSPGYGLGGSICSIVDHFKDYVVFKPDGDSHNIYVTLGRVFWDWSAGTSYAGGAWSSPTYQVNGPSSPDDSNEFPMWTNIISNVGIPTSN